MRCLSCNHDNERNARFCSACGARLPAEEPATENVQAVPLSAEHVIDLSELLEQLAEGESVLVVESGEIAGSRYLITSDVTSIGRHPDSTIFLDDVTVSRRHATLTRTGSTFRIRDAGALNGTYRNGVLVTDDALESGDQVQIGRFVLRFYVAGAS